MILNRCSSLLFLLLIFGSVELVQAQNGRRSTTATAVTEKEKSSDKAETQTEIKWAEIELSGMLPEGPSLPGLFGEISESVNRIFARLDRAIEDEEVDAIVLKINNPLVGMGTVYELHTKIKAIRKQGKPVYAMLETALTPDYLIATACDKIYQPEPGMLLMTGMRAEVSFYKNLFDRLDIEADILRVGKYKAAAEPYTRTEMSPEFREEISELLDGQYAMLIKMIADSRGLTEKEVEAAINTGPHTAASALEAGLIDGLYYSDQLEEIALANKDDATFKLAKKYGKEKVDVNFDGFTGMMKMMNLMMGVEPRSKKSVEPQIAVIYATGAITSGRGSGGVFGGDGIGSETMIETIREAAENDRVKAIVLRVNSPGGSALASDLIWRALEKVDKPIVVSMGDVAASGGYYISMGADYIYAEPGTVTGSIGVVGGKLALEGLFEKIGITTSYVTRGDNSGALSAMQPFNDSERKAMQKMMNDIYELFVTKAAEGRDMKVERLKELGGGRIYTGEVAVKNGLVDEIGTLDQAVEKAKELADLKGNNKVERLLLPKPTSPFEQLFGPIDTRMQQASVAELLEGVLPVELTAQLKRALMIDNLSKTEPRLLLMPFDLKFE